MGLNRQKIYLSENWHFHLGDLPRLQNMIVNDFHAMNQTGGALHDVVIDTSDKSWKEVSLPHDWLSELPVSTEGDMAGGYKVRGVAWYTNTFTLSINNMINARLVFEGILGSCKIYVNGVFASINISGYNRIICDVGDYLVSDGNNTVTIFVDASRCEGWWYEGAGIYRSVYLEIETGCAIDSDMCFVKPFSQDGNWYLDCNVVLTETSNVSREQTKLQIHLTDPNGICVWDRMEVACQNNQLTIPVDTPLLWSPETPHLYKLQLILITKDETADVFILNVGLRSIEWIPGKGMYLNGSRYQVKGACCHQDHAGVGAAVTKELIEYRISKLKNLGINAYRCAHNAPDKNLLDICDRMGMLVMVENRHFDVSAETFRQLDDLVLLSRNHPSVFMYSVFNEEPWQKEIRGSRIGQKLRARIRKLDDTRAITGSQNAGLLESSNVSQEFDVIGINYNLKYYDSCHERIPEKVIIGTENCPTFGTRGVYNSNINLQEIADYCEEWASNFSESIEETMEYAFGKEYVAGCFVWSGFDHRGETQPYEWPSVISHWGIMDNCGFEKNTAYLIASWYRTEPFIHLLPHWNWKSGDVIKVCAFSNTEEAELFVNGKSYGIKPLIKRRAEWMVPFESGKVSVCGYSDSKTVYDEIKTAGPPAKLMVEKVNTFQNEPVSIVNIRVVDITGVAVPDFDEELNLSIANGKIIGVGNGNPNGHGDDIANNVKMFHGCAQVIVSGKEAVLTVGCDGLPMETLYCRQ